ncbi:Mitochondrial ribonuclease P protein 1-like protein [Armadillidium nasatum]|uniref:RNA (guanine-9-)-methyltransferase domain-containing protein 1 n=1 Tax=Armadillidium nasatum TaxID=96803 RepID=A0A5N5SXV1_9CRUS|nr:Mitochondrial ribonuclease P protein 1-like protein [Armadillidium nasatum]
MYSKQLLAGCTRYIQLIPIAIERKCVNSGVPNFSYESPPKDQLPESLNNGFNSEEKMKLKKWIDMVRFEGGRVPNNISEEDFSELLSMENEFIKLKYLYFLFSKENSKMNDNARKERMKEIKRQKQIEKHNRPKGHIEYGIWKNSIFSKITKHHSKSLLNYKLVNAMMFSQPLIIDLSFFHLMERREVSSLVEQLAISISQNRNNIEPFNLTLCNVDFDSKKYQQIYKFMPNVSKPNFPMNITTSSYIDIFPKEKLVYLTPNARDEMKEFDHEAIYIIGGYVNLREGDPITEAKAKRENIKSMKLPIERYHIMKKRGDLGIHVMVNILLDLQRYGDFKKAFKNIPRRLLFTSNDSHLEAYNKKFSKF